MRTATLLTIIVLLSGCSATAFQSADVSYVDETFTYESIQSGGIAILPVVAGQGVEGYRRPFGDAINEYIGEHGYGIDFLAWQETMERINDAGIASAYTSAIATYRETSILDRSLIQEIGRATSLRYLLFAQLDAPTDESVRGRGALASGYYDYQTIGASAFAQVWDAATGDVVWEASGRAGVRELSEFDIIKDEDRDPNTHSRRVANEIVSALFE